MSFLQIYTESVNLQIYLYFIYILYLFEILICNESVIIYI